MGPKTLGQDKMLVIVDYDMGNVRSVAKAFDILGVKTLISRRLDDIKRAGWLVLPGVGAFGDGMGNLRKFGLIEALTIEVLKNRKPFLGICLGMQLLARDSQEFGQQQGLGWLKASVKPFEFKDRSLKVPHVGWNKIRFKENCPLFNHLKQETAFYFVHSYYFECDSPELSAASCDYGMGFTAAVWQDNIFATQFHPEKSQLHGLKLLQNFINWRPTSL